MVFKSRVPFENKREKFSRLGKERVMDFSADKIVSQYEKLILFKREKRENPSSSL